MKEAKNTNINKVKPAYQIQHPNVYNYIFGLSSVCIIVEGLNLIVADMQKGHMYEEKK